MRTRKRLNRAPEKIRRSKEFMAIWKLYQERLDEYEALVGDLRKKKTILVEKKVYTDNYDGIREKLKGLLSPAQKEAARIAGCDEVDYAIQFILAVRKREMERIAEMGTDTVGFFGKWIHTPAHPLLGDAE